MLPKLKSEVFTWEQQYAPFYMDYSMTESYSSLSSKQTKPTLHNIRFDQLCTAYF